MKITDQQKKQYLKNEGCNCPFCSSDEIEGAGVMIETAVATQKMFCNDCSGSWEDVYTLTNVVEVAE